MRDFTFNNFFAESCCSSSNSSSKTGRNSVIMSILMFFVGLIAFAQAPTVTSFTPTSAGVGQTVTITGTNFSSATAVSFGLIPATSFTVVNSTTITAVVGTGATGSVRVTNPSGAGQKSGFRFLAAPSCNLDGILKACLNDGNIQITATVEFSTASPTLSYSFPVGPQNTTGAFLVSTGPFIYDPINNTGTQVTVINPGTTGGQINYQLNVTNAGGTCECSKSITIINMELETFSNPILCNGGTTSIFADASSTGSTSYTFTLNPGNIILGPHQDPSVEFTNIPAGNYTITVSDNNGCFKTVPVTVTQPPVRPIVLNCPQNIELPSCVSQELINSEFNNWLRSFSYSGGTNPMLTVTPSSPTAPLLCGTALQETVTVTWTVTDDCNQRETCTRRFTINRSAPVDVDGPDDLTVSSCDYTSQVALQTAYNAWLAQFVTIEDGCEGFASFGEGAQFDAPDLCDGGSVTLIYTIADECSTDMAMSTFTVVPDTPVDVTGPNNFTASSCDFLNQDALDAAYAAWVARFITVNNGCDATASFGEDGIGRAPRLCQGGTVSLTYSIADNCTQDSHTATFTITPSTTSTTTAPNDSTTSACAYPNQAAANAAFNSWLAQFNVSGGCSASGNAGQVSPPNFCGGSTTVVYTITDRCQGTQTITRTFTIERAPAVDVNGPNNFTASSCQYPNQAALDAAYAAWVAQFTTVNRGCNATASFANGSGTAPRLCQGGRVSLTYSIADNCSQDSASASFTITPAPAVDVTGPNNFTASSCQYSNQAALDAAYAAWVAQFTTVNSGCNATASFANGSGTAPRLCDGGTVNLTYSIADNCSQDSASASFTITPAPAVVVNSPVNSTNSACTYANQTALNTAFNAWLGQFTATGGCTPNGSFQGGTPTVPVLCTGGIVTVTYNVTDRCYTTSVTRTFTITPAPSVSVNKPNNVCLSACTYVNQAALNTAFNAWLAQFTATGGCTPTGSFQGGTPAAPTLCTGGTVTVTYNVTDKCFTTCVSATYTVTPAPAVTVNKPNDVCVNACNYTNQTALNTAFTNWLNCFTVSGGCAPTGTFQGGTPIAPVLCNGGVVRVTYVVTDKCYSTTITRTFTVNAPSQVQVSSPNNITISGCSYSSQSALNTAFNNWLCQFKVSGGCAPTGTFQGGTPSAPTLCAGGTTTVVYVITDKCHSSTVSKTFTVTPSAVDVTGPSNYTASTCDFSSQTALDTAFNNWIAQFRVVSSGCNGQAYFSAAYCAPRLCQGGTITVTYNIKGNCNDDSYTARFTINPASNVVINRPADVTVSACTYTSQTALNAAYTAWLNGFSVSGGCAPSGTFTTTPPTTAPSLCNGGSVCVSYRVVDVCFNATTFTRTFTVNGSSSVTVNRPNNECVNACSYTNQAALDTAFNNWLNCFSVSGGCSAAGSFQGGRPTAPALCTGGTKTVTYVVNTGCYSTTVTRTYTVNAPAPVIVCAPSNACVNAWNYSSQTALNTAFNNWLCEFKVSGGCCPTGTIQGTPCAPSRSTGGTTTVTYVVTDKCHSSTVTRTFTVVRNTTRPAASIVPTTNVKIVAYPNPYTQTFGVEISSSDSMEVIEEKVSITVYDMAGKLIDQSVINSSELSSMKYGDRYPSGVYNVVVNTGDVVKTLRVIKR